MVFHDAAAQCTKDTDCKGNRICVNGNCIEPPQKGPGESSSQTAQPAVQPAPAAGTAAENAASQPQKAQPAGQVYSWQLSDEEKDVVRSGAGIFYVTAIFYGFGTLYSSVMPIIVSFADMNKTYYNGDVTNQHYDDDLYVLIAPQTAGFVLFGGLNQIAKLQQRSVLKELGRPSPGIYKLGWIMYAVSIAVAGLDIASFSSDNQGLAATMSFVNAAVCLSSYAINIAAYSAQRGTLREAVTERARARHSEAVEIVPYLGFSGKKCAAGLAMRF